MKHQSIFKSMLCLLMLMICHISWATDKVVSLQFSRTGTDVSSVTLNVKDESGELISGATATLVASSEAFKATAGSITSAILCPNKNANTNPTIELTFQVSGLPQGMVFNRMGLDIHALNGSNSYQQSNDNVVRQWNVAAATACGDAEFAEFAALNDIDIAAGVTGGHKVWEMETESPI